MSVLSTRVPGQLRRGDYCLGNLALLATTFLGLLTSVLISDNFTGGFCDVGIGLLRNDIKP